MTRSPGQPTDAQWFRTVLGQCPTAVSVITADEPGVGPAGMVVGTFVSVSLDPPLVGFLPAKSSSSWPAIERAGAFCVNVLAADQEDVCRRFAAKGTDKFAGVEHSPGAVGAPHVSGCAAWIECELESVQDVGDHYFVVGRVRSLELGEPGFPLIFFQGGYGRFTSSSLAAPDDRGQLTQQLRYVDRIRGEMEDLADELGGRCIASARVGDELVIVAAAGTAKEREGGGTLVGQRVPNLPGTGTILAAWDSKAEIDEWLLLCHATDQKVRHTIDVVRARGYSLSIDSPEQREFFARIRDAALRADTSSTEELHSAARKLVYDPDELTPEVKEAVRQISAPVFDKNARVALALTIYGFGTPDPDLDTYIGRVVDGASRATASIAGVQPTP